MSFLDSHTAHQNASISIIVLAPIVFVLSLWAQPYAGYGKLHNKGKAYTGILLPGRLSWFLFESPNLVWTIVAYRNRDQAVFQTPNAVLLLAFFLHYINRCILYPIKMSPQSRTPIAISLMAGAYTTVNGWIQTYELCIFKQFEGDYIGSTQFISGLLLMLAAFLLTRQADEQLCQLRKRNMGYQIPRGGLFEFISTPHFLGEILEWTGFAVASGGSVAVWSFPIFTAANLVPRSLSQHQWYQRKFKDYPTERKAILPFLL